MPLTIEEAIQRVPFLAGRSDLAIHPLTGGITNLNFKVESSEGTYVIRITGADTNLLGINRQAEYMANLEAGRLGIAPEVLFFIEPEGYLVTRFIHASTLPPPEMRKRENLGRVAARLRLFHEKASALPAEFNAFRSIEQLVAASRSHQCAFPRDFDWIAERVSEVERVLLKDPYCPSPCHDDLLNLNFLNEGGELRILDWEYAGMGDIFFDLANFSHHHELNDEQIEQFLQFYFGEVRPAHKARLRLMWPVSEVREALWGTLQSGISKLDEDFEEYANHWSGLARTAFKDERWQSWMDIAAPSSRR
jgi:thiamine kinase-like enzyme